MSHATAGLPTGPADRAPSRLPVRASLLAAPMIDKLKFHITRLRRMQFGRQGSTTFSRSMGHSGFDAVTHADRNQFWLLQDTIVDDRKLHEVEFKI